MTTIDAPMNARSVCFCELKDLAGAEGFLTRIRRQLHQNPELSFQEEATAALVAEQLEGWGWQVTRNVGGHGVVGTMSVGAGNDDSTVTGVSRWAVIDIIRVR